MRIYWTKPRLRKQPTVGDATTGFPGKWRLRNASVKSSSAQPPRGYCGAFARLVSPRGWGICKFCGARGPGISQPPGHSRAFDTHAVSYQNVATRQIILLGKKADWLICQGQREEKAEEGCKGMFLILCMHFFIDYQARITQRNRELSTWINVFWLSNQISVDIIWKTTSIFIKLFINITLQRSIYFNVNNLHKYLIINWCMSSRLLQRKTLIETKNRTLKCLKWHYSTVRSGGLTSQEPSPPRICHPRPKICQSPEVSRGGWAQLELTDVKRE